MKLNELTLSEASKLLQSGEIEPIELVEDCLARIELREEKIQAFTHYDRIAALLQARSLNSNERNNPLFGIPIGIKDIINTYDMPTTMGSRIYSNHQPARDSAIVAMCRQAGAVIPGKTETTEFAYFYPGKTRNPHHRNHTPGGSSMGSAAAVADCMLPYAIGTQTAASVIRPAAYCGVVGYKSTHGSFSLEGVCGLAQNLDSIGFFVRDVRDLTLIRNGLLGAPFSLDEEISMPLRIGFMRTPHWGQVESYQQEALLKTCDDLVNNGHIVLEIDVTPSDEVITEYHAIIMAYEASRSLIGEYRNSCSRLSPQILKLIEDGQNTTYLKYQQALTLAQQWRQELHQQTLDLDMLLAPSALGEAPKGLDTTGDPIMSRMWTLLHVPTITLPSGTGPLGLPLGFQLIGIHGLDDRLISFAIRIASEL